jgi:hypothetical protein
MSPSDRCFTICSRSVGVVFHNDQFCVVANRDQPSEWVHWERVCLGIEMPLVTLQFSLVAILLPARKMHFYRY